MNALDVEWEERLKEARQKARAAGRGDVADYLSLRAANDMARTTGVQWLLEAFMALAGEANRAGAGLAFARDEAHRFPVGTSTMIGAKLTLRAGVRVLTIEAGWPRTPSDGIVRGGGLAGGRLSHFGDRAAGDDLLLVQKQAGAPQWLVLDATGTRTELTEDRMRRHVTRLFETKQ